MAKECKHLDSARLIYRHHPEKANEMCSSVWDKLFRLERKELEFYISKVLGVVKEFTDQEYEFICKHSSDVYDLSNENPLVGEIKWTFRVVNFEDHDIEVKLVNGVLVTVSREKFGKHIPNLRRMAAIELGLGLAMSNPKVSLRWDSVCAHVKDDRSGSVSRPIEFIINLFALSDKDNANKANHTYLETSRVEVLLLFEFDTGILYI